MLRCTLLSQHRHRGQLHHRILLSKWLLCGIAFGTNTGTRVSCSTLPRGWLMVSGGWSSALAAVRSSTAGIIPHHYINGAAVSVFVK